MGDNGDKVDATREARRLADAEGIDLRAVDGTGAGGKIGIDDVRNALRERELAKKAPFTFLQVARRESDMTMSLVGDTQTLSTGGTALTLTEPTPKNIEEQYTVLSAILKSPTDGSISLPQPFDETNTLRNRFVTSTSLRPKDLANPSGDKVPQIYTWVWVSPAARQPLCGARVFSPIG